MRNPTIVKKVPRKKLPTFPPFCESGGNLPFMNIDHIEIVLEEAMRAASQMSGKMGGGL